jgi:excisionase family DNA binding protein
MKNRYFVSGDLTVIEIKNEKRPKKTFYTIIDTCNLPIVLAKCKRISVVIDQHTNYAICYTKENKHMGFHRLLLNTPRNLVVDHRNHNGLDNRLANIWNCTRKENNQNKRFKAIKNPDYIGKKKVQPYTNEGTPLVLTVDHVASYLSIGRNAAYELMNQKDFPVYKIGKLYKRVNRDEFFQWLHEQSKIS